ncbi:MAG TPA: hypothetical protein VF598_09370 [Hymenobacter sp.]
MTWDEPWQEQVVRKADYFILARINSNDLYKGASLQVLKKLGGPNIPGDIQINAFYLLQMCNNTGAERPEFHLGIGDTAYFFLKKGITGFYSIATPTSGYARVRNGNVGATYRHSYHQALVPAIIYEPTMTAIFQRYHQQPYDSVAINAFVDKYLALPPTSMSREGASTFFMQHVALELVYHLQLTGKYDQLLPFLHATNNFHAQNSAARALTAYNTPEAKQELLKSLADNTLKDFTKTTIITTLVSYNPTELKPQLEELAKTASEAENGFGNSERDPRSCTHLPTVREALQQLVAKL